MCQPNICFSSWLLFPLCLAASATAMASTLNAAALRSLNARPSTPLLKLHVQTLRLNPNAGQRPRYVMRAPRLRLVSGS